MNGSASGSNTGSTNWFTLPASNWMITGMPLTGPPVLLLSLSRKTSASTRNMSSPALMSADWRQQFSKKALKKPNAAYVCTAVYRRRS